MNKFKILVLIPTLSLLLVTTLNIANADLNEDNPVPFLPPFQHSQSQSHSQLHPVPQQPQQYQQHINQSPHKQPMNSNQLNNSHKSQFDNHSPSVTSVMPF
jgi:hypothetical protein